MKKKDRLGVRDRQESTATRPGMERVIRRLNLLELLILGGAGTAAIAGGWLTAWLARSAVGAPFRPTWFVASFALFVVPGFLVWNRERRGHKPSSAEPSPSEPTPAEPSSQQTPPPSTHNRESTDASEHTQ